MKYLLLIAFCSLVFLSCEKDDQPQENLAVEGYWLVLRDTTFTAAPANANCDLYHLFKAPNAYYRFSFPNTFDFSVLTAKPRADSMISFYQTVGNQLQIPNPAPSTTNNVPGNDLLSKTDNQMVFTRYVITRRNATTGKVEQSRTDTITYLRVTDATKIQYFNNYLKQWHP